MTTEFTVTDQVFQPVEVRQQFGGMYYLGEGPARFRVDRVKISRDGTHCELAVRIRSGGTPEMPEGTDSLVHMARVNMLSGRSRDDIAKKCEERFPGEKVGIPSWSKLIERVCLTVLEVHRQGEPAIDLAAAAPVEALAYRVFPFMTDNGASVIFGEGGTGKSMFALYVAILQAAGVTDQAGMTVEPGNVGYWDWEASEEETKLRYDMIVRGLALQSPPKLIYRFFSEPLVAEGERIHRLIQEYSLAAHIIDSAAPACDGPPETSEAALGFFRVVRDFRRPALVLAHQRSGEGDIDKPFGSIYWRNIPRTVWQIRKEETYSQTEFKVGMFHRKVNNGPLMRPRGFQADFGLDMDDKETVSYEAIDLSRTDLAGSLSVGDKIQACLQIAPDGRLKKSVLITRLREMSDVSGGRPPKEGTINKVLSVDARFISLGGGLWGMAASGQQASLVP